MPLDRLQTPNNHHPSLCPMPPPKPPPPAYALPTSSPDTTLPSIVIPLKDPRIAILQWHFLNRNYSTRDEECALLAIQDGTFLTCSIRGISRYRRLSQYLPISIEVGTVQGYVPSVSISKQHSIPFGGKRQVIMFRADERRLCLE